MANNRQIVSIGVQLDYKRELEGMLDDLRAQMKKLGDSAKDIELSANLQKQISTLESRLAVVSDDIADMFRKMGDQDIDIKAFSKFQNEITGMTRKIQTEMLDLKRMLEGLSEGTDASKMFSHFSEMESKFAELRTEIQTTTRLITDFYEPVKGTSSKATINFQSDFDEKKLQRAKELLKQLEDLNKKEREVYNYDRESKYTDSTPMEDFEKSFDAIIKRWNELNKLQKELKTRANNGEGVDFYKEQIAAIRAEKDLLYQEMDDMVDALSERKNISDAVARRVEQFTNNPYKPFEGEDTKNVINSLKGQIGEMKKVQKEAEAAAEAASQNVEISMFSIKNGKINVPIEIDVIQKQRDKTLEQSILNTIEKLQEVIKSHPVLLDVKLKTNNNPYDKEGVKKKLLTQKDVKEYFNSDIDDIQTLDDKDLGKNFFNSFIESSKEAYNVAKVVIDKINETLNVTKIKITKDNISIDEDTIKGLSEQFSKMFDEAQIDQFVEYFAESFSSLLGANDFEEALLQSLNNATDRWVQHFNESMTEVRTLLDNGFEGANTVDQVDTAKIINEEIATRIKKAKQYKERYDRAEGDAGGWYYVNMERELARLSILKKHANDSNIDISQYADQLKNIKDLAYYNDLIQKGWKKYFNRTDDHSVKADEYLKDVLPQEMKEVDAKINLDAETIAVWRQTFLDAIAEVSVSLKSSLSSSAASSVDSWRNGMMDAVNEVAGQFASAMKGTADLSSMFAGSTPTSDGFNELYYVLSGWRNADNVIRRSRTVKEGYNISDALKEVGFGPDNIGELTGLIDRNTGEILDSKIMGKLYDVFMALEDDYNANREFIGELERSGMYDLETGKFINGFSFDHNGSTDFADEEEKLYGRFDKFGFADLSKVIKFHSHPIDKRFLSNPDEQQVIGSDLFFSDDPGDISSFAYRHRMNNLKKYAVTSNGKVHYLDFSQFTNKQVDEISDEYRKQANSQFQKILNESFHTGVHKGKDYGTEGVFDFDEYSEKGIKLLGNAIKKVTGVDPSTVQHVFDIEEIKQNPKKFRDMGFLLDSAQISDTTELLETMAATIQKISDGGGFKIDTSSIDSLANSLQEILVILQRIHEEANIAFSIPDLNILSGNELQEKATDIIGENIDNLKSQIGVKDALLPVFKDYYDGIGKLKSGKDIWKDVFKEDSDFAFDDLSHIFQDKESYRQAIISWYDEYAEKQKQIANINEELFNIGSSTKATDGLKFDVSSEDLENIASHLREILDLMKQLYDASSVGKLQAQWSEIESKFKSFAKDDGSVDARKKEYSELIGMIQQYQKMGGEDFSSLTDNTKTIEKINASLEKARAKEVTEETHSTEGTVNDVAQAFEKIETAAKEFSDIIEPVIKNVDRLIEVLSKTPENGGIGEYLENLGGKLDVFGGLDAKKIKAVSSALKSLEGIKLDNLQSVPAFSAFINDLNRLQVQAEVIKDIAEIMKQTKGKPVSNNITGIKGYKNANAIPDALYNAEYENWAKRRKEFLQKELNQNGEVRYNQVGETSISHLSSGLVNMTNIVQTADGGWKQLTVTMDNSFKTIEKASKIISESQGMRALGLVSEKEEKVLQANLKEALKLAKEYQIASAKSGSWDVLSPTATEKLTIDNVKRLDNEIKATSKDQFSGQTQALLKQYDDQITLGGGEFVDRVQTAKNLLEELDVEVKTVVDDLKQMSGPEAARAADKITADYSAYVSDYISGAATQETLDKKTGGLLSRYKNIVGFYRGIDSQDARTAYLKDYIKSTYGDFEYDWSKGSKTGMGKDVDTVIAKYKDLNNEVRTVTATIDTSTNAIRVQQTASAQYVNGLDKFFTSLKAKVLEGARYLMAYVSIQDLWRYFREGVSVVNEFDTALTEMRKVSDEALITLQKFQSESFDIADAVGTTALQIQQSTADFMRLGDTLEQAKKNAATANTLLNVSEFESIDDATTSLIAMEAAYKNLSGTEIIDKLNNIGKLLPKHIVIYGYC